MEHSDVIIIGAGPAGLMCGLNIKKYNNKCKVIILEHKDKPGKKILATGNGKCNFTNDVFDEKSYRGENPDFAYRIISKIDKEKIIGFMENEGVIPVNVNGYYYPRSNQAQTILNIFETCHVRCNEDVTGIQKLKKGYKVVTEKNEYSCSYLVLATGGKASMIHGSDGSGYKLCKSLGHRVTDLYPSLTGLKCSGLDFNVCRGVRTKAGILLKADKKDIISEYGEIQFTEYGVSGIPVFQISRYASACIKENKEVNIIVELVPEYEYEFIRNSIIRIMQASKDNSILKAVNAFIPLKLAMAIIDSENARYKATYKDINNKELSRIAGKLKSLKIKVKGDMGFERAQVTAGGVDTREVNNQTMESYISPGLYIVGELLDVDGNCGGYNLHFAFATGMLAADDILRKVKS